MSTHRRPLTTGVLTWILGLLLLVFPAQTSLAAPTTPPAAPTSPTSPTAPTAPGSASRQGLAQLTQADADAWLDGAVLSMLDQGQLPGATVSIVKDGQLVTARGFGTADKQTRFHDGATPVDPNRHLFRIGSVSKLFTAVAAMQLVEQGKLDLDADVQQYLDFKLDTPKGAITARHLMTHTAGFEEYMGPGFMTDSPETLRSLDQTVRDMPRQIYQPGTTPAYSNHGTALLGYLVQRISGEPYADYVDAHIFKPLGMTHTSAAQPLPANLAPDLASGFVNLTEPAQPFEHISTAPAGSISSTAADMARFANFVLGHGPQILKPETLAQMQRPALDPAKAPLSAQASDTLGLQFWLAQRNGVRMVNHGGDTNLFHSMFAVFPDQQVGIFISSNGNGNGDVDLRNILDGFVDRYVAAQQPAGPAIATAKQDAAKVAGTYALSRQQQSGVLKVTSLLSQIRLVADEDGSLTAPMLEAKFRETAPNTWTLVEGRNLMATEIVTDGGDRAALIPAHTLIRVPWWEHQFLAAGLAIGWLIASIWALISGIVGARRRRKANRAARAADADAKTPAPVTKTTLWTRRLTPWAIFAPLSLVAAMLFLQSMSNLTPSPALVHVMHVFICIAAIAGLAAAVRTVSAVTAREGWKPIVGNGLLTLAMIVFVTQCVQFNLLQFGVRF